MNRYFIAIAALLVLVVAVIGVMFFLRPAPATPPAQQGGTPSNTNTTTPPAGSADQSQGAVQAAFKSQIAPYVTDNLKLQETAIAGDYALQAWASDSKGGEGLLKHDPVQNRWVLVSGGGGVWTVGALVGEGVPTTTAQALLAGLSQY